MMKEMRGFLVSVVLTAVFLIVPSREAFGVEGPALKYLGRHTDTERQILYLLTERTRLCQGCGGQAGSLSVIFRDYAATNYVAFATTVSTPTVTGRVENAVGVASLPPGVYRLDFCFKAADGSVELADHDYYAKPAADGCFAGNQVGLKDVVPFPWTKPTAGNASFSCWSRDYALGGEGLVTSVRTLGQEILSAPVTLWLDGRPLAFDCALVEQGVSYAEYALTARAAALPVRVLLRAEFDGYLKFKVDYGQMNAKHSVKRLELRVPLKRSVVAGYDDCRTYVGKLPLPAGKKGTWSFDPNWGPFFWFGDAERGLMGGGDSIRGWHLKDKSRGYVLTVDDTAAVLAMNLVDVPFVLKERRTVEFYLEATPARPRDRKHAEIALAKLEPHAMCYNRFFDEYLPGFVNESEVFRWRDVQRQGKEVYYYFAVAGMSPASPWWGWFADRWNVCDDPLYSIWEVPQASRDKREHCIWTKTCMNERSFFDFKLGMIDWFLSRPDFEAKNLYFDLAFPIRCRNTAHGCGWKDEFGDSLGTWYQDALREFHKRILIRLQEKDPAGTIRGHLQVTRTPSDAFFARLVMGEVYENRVAKHGNYYDVFMPEDLQIVYASRAAEQVIDIAPQIYRATYVYNRDLLKDYSPEKPEWDRAIRHACAYLAIHDLKVGKTHDHDGPQWKVAADQVETLGVDRKMRAYFHADCPVSVAPAAPRTLYTVHSGNGKAFLVLLNDTDAEATMMLSFDPKAVGVTGGTVGREVFGHGDADFASGKVTVTLGPRESRFWSFK